MDSYQSSAKAYSGKFILLTLIFVLIIGLLSGLLFIRDEQVKIVLEEHLPVLTKSTEVDTLKTTLHRNVEAVNSTSDGENMWRYHQSLIETLKLLKPLSANSSYDKLLPQLASYDQQVERLSQVNERNNQLRNQVVIQLQLLVDQLRLVENETQKQKNAAKQKLESNNRISIGDARDQLRIMERYQLYRQSLDNMELVLEMFKSLSLNTNLTQLVILSDRIETIIVHWQGEFSLSESHSEEALAAFELIQALNGILYTETRAIAKWRSAIRITNEYRLALSTIPELNVTSLDSQSIVSQEIPTYLPSQIKSHLESYSWFNPVMIQWAIFALAGLGAFCCLMLLSAIKRSIISQNKKNISVVESYAEGEAVDINDLNEEIHELCQLIDNIEKPEHGEKDYQKVCRELTQVNRLLARGAKIYVWQVSESHPYRELAQQLASSSSGMLKSWREHFTKETVKNILASAKSAKQQSQLIELTVNNIKHDSFKLFLLYKDSVWYGFLQAENVIKEIQSELKESKRLLEKESKAHASQVVEYAENMSDMLVAAMLQTQIPQADQKSVTSKLYRQLSRMNDWCHQKAMFAKVNSQDSNMALLSVNLLSELRSIFYSLNSEAQIKRNELSFSIANDIEPNVQLNTVYFRHCIDSVIRASFADVINSSIDVSVRLADKNKGQQIIKLTLEHHSDRKAIELPARLSTLVEEVNRSENELTDKKKSTLASMIEVIHGSDVIAETTDFGYRFVISIPCTIESQTAIKENKDLLKLKNSNLLLVDDGQHYNKQMITILESYHADVATLSDASYFSQQVSIAHLQKKAIDLVILTPNLFKSDFSSIEQHIRSLPAALRPKLLCIQPIHFQALSRVGFFEHAISLCQTDKIVEGVASLLASEDKTNELIPAEMFVQHQAVVSQLDLLLAVQDPQAHQPLYRLLRWLGFNVYVVSHNEALQEQWRSGRFMILVTEFDEMPETDLAVGNSINRSIFTLDNALCSNKLQKTKDNWQVATLPPLEDFSKFIKSFEPWLIEQFSYQAPATKTVTNIPETQVTSKTSKPSAKNDMLLEELSAFDIVKFAENQGGAELAGLMLEEYVGGINELIEQLSNAISSADRSKAAHCLDEMTTLAKIIAAPDILQAISKIEALLCELSSPMLANEMIELKLAHEKLTLASEAI